MEKRNMKTTLAGGTSGVAIIVAALQSNDLATMITGCVVGVGLILLGFFAKDSVPSDGQ